MITSEVARFRERALGRPTKHRVSWSGIQYNTVTGTVLYGVD